MGSRQTSWARQAGICLAGWLLLGGCMDWSPALLQRDAAGGEASLDVGLTDARRDAGDAATDGDTDTAADSGCGICAGNTPICDSVAGVCRGCLAIEECGTTVCLADGRCAVPQEVVHVAVNRCDEAQEEGTQQRPFCGVTAALGTTGRILRVEAGVYGPVKLFDNQELHGTSGAIIRGGSNCEALLIDGSGVVVSNFTIGGQKDEANGGVKVTSNGSGLLIANTIGPSSCVGVNAAGAIAIDLQRNFITRNERGGVEATEVTSATLVNNIITDNGDTDSAYGGVRLKVKAAGTGLFAHNTVADNISKGGSSDSPGVRCDAAIALESSIIWNNKPAPSTLPQISGNCTASYSDVQNDGTPLPGTGNMDQEPLFVGGGSGAAAYHLQSTSLCIDAASAPAATLSDYDNNPRHDGKPDIGADEVNK